MSSEVVVRRYTLQNRTSKKFCKIYRKTPVLRSLFNKAVGFRPPISAGLLVNDLVLINFHTCYDLYN